MLEASRYLWSSRVRGEQSFAVVEVERVNGQRSKISGYNKASIFISISCSNKDKKNLVA